MLHCNGANNGGVRGQPDEGEGEGIRRISTITNVLPGGAVGGLDDSGQRLTRRLAHAPLTQPLTRKQRNHMIGASTVSAIAGSASGGWEAGGSANGLACDHAQYSCQRTAHVEWDLLRLLCSIINKHQG